MNESIDVPLNVVGLLLLVAWFKLIDQKERRDKDDAMVE